MILEMWPVNKIVFKIGGKLHSNYLKMSFNVFLIKDLS